MDKPIERAVVIGAGTMGAQVAAHLANAGVRTTLLDIVPAERSEEQREAGLAFDSREHRNRLAREGLERALAARPAAFFSDSKAAWISVGNLEDDFGAVAEADWVIEAIVENLAIKRELMGRIDEQRSPDAIVSTNTSGIPVHQIAEGRSEGFRSHFLGTHFFNPPRYLKLLELIPTEDTDAQVVDRIREFATIRLGKGVVPCKDTPNFIANRLGSVDGAFTLDYALAHGYTVEEVDALTGPIIGRPKTATFRLLDLVGLDVASHVRSNLVEALPQEPASDVLRSARAEEVTSAMIERGWLGNKAEAGFYKKVVEGGEKSYWPLNLQTLKHEPPEEPRFESLAAAQEREGLADRLQSMLAAEDRGGELVRAVVFHGLAYASERIPEIADSPRSIDLAMRWGFQHELGPFELWDQLGVGPTAGMMKEAGYPPAAWVEEMLEQGHEAFYQYDDGQPTGVYHPIEGAYQRLAPEPAVVRLSALKADGKTVEDNEGASLIDLGEGVVLLEFHTKGNTLDEDVFEMIERGLERLEREFVGMVVANEAANFSLGANLFTVAVAAQNELWDQLEEAVQRFQDLNMRVRYCPRPIVVAPAGMALGGGCEMTMHGARAVAAAESYIGLVEVGAGVIPAGGGCKEMLRRVVNPVMEVDNGDVLPPMQKLFESVGQGEVARSAVQARQMGFLGEGDRIVMNREHLIAEAKREVLHLAPGYQPPDPREIYAAGRDVLAALKIAIFGFLEAGYISEFDSVIGEKLASVLTGGDLSSPQWVEPQYILDLEREAFLSLAGEEKTQARMWHLLQEGKPLRN